MPGSANDVKPGTHESIADSRNDTVQIYINGEFFIRDEAKVSVFDSGFMLGDGVWEGLRLHNGKFLFEDLHIKRLFEGNESDDRSHRQAPTASHPTTRDDPPVPCGWLQGCHS